MNILVITSVLPAPLAGKARENDVLFKTADCHHDINKNVRYIFLFVIPYANILLSLLSKKWKEYRLLKNRGYYSHGDKYVRTVAIPGFKNDYWIKKTLIRLGLWMNSRKMSSIIRDENIDLIHAHNIGADLAIARAINKKYNIPYVVTTRNIHNGKITNFVKDNLRHASALVSLTPTLKKIADNYNENSLLIPHGIDNSFFLDHKSNSKGNVLKITTICRLLDWKNVDKIIYALARVGFDFQYDIYGDGPHKIALKKIIDDSPYKGKIRLLDFVPYSQVPETLSQYDIFVLVSFPETFGRIYIEAMASGLPIIAAKGCGMDGFIENGKEGFVVPHEKIDSLVELFDYVSNNREILTSLSNNAQKLARNFKWNEIVRQINDVYINALK